MDQTKTEEKSLDAKIKPEVWPEWINREQTILHNAVAGADVGHDSTVDIKLNVVKTEPVTPPHYGDYEVCREDNICMNAIKQETVSMVNHEPSEEENGTWSDGPIPVALYKSLVSPQSEFGIDKLQETVTNFPDPTMPTDQCLITRRRRVQHEDLSHRGKKLYKCCSCSYSTVSKENLKVHKRSHTGERPYKCSLCLYKAVKISNLKAHERIHTGEKPYNCSMCSYSAAQKGDLNKHERTHTGDKPHRCAMCSFCTAVKSSLRRHERIHSGDKPHRCTMCSYSTAQKGNLEDHERTHTGEKPYRCTICSYSTARKATLKIHKRILHK